MASDLPVDLLEDIFLRLDDVADLARASVACSAFRRVVSDGRFLRQFRSLHRRPVLGFLADNKKRREIFFPAQPPRRSAQAAAGFAKAADFTFSFLPEPKRWRVCDARDGRVLLLLTRRHRRTRGHGRHRTLSDLQVDLSVYDPLHRRHVQIPTIPGDLLQSAKAPDDNYNNEGAMAFDDPFLAPAADDDGEGGFQVMFTALIDLPKTKVVAFVFSSVSGQWRRVVSFCTGLPISNYLGSNDLPSVWLRQYVHSWVCWAHYLEDVMLVLDTRETMKLWITDLPRKSAARSKMVVEAGDGRLGLLLLSYDGCTAMDLYSKPAALQGRIDQWRHDSSIPLIPGFQLMFAGAAAEGYVLLHGFRLDGSKKKKPEVHYFTLEVKTLLAEKLCVLEYHQPRNSFLYASFPPLFSSPSIV